MAKNKIKGGKGVIYARYSSHNQKDISIEQQVEKCREISDSYGIIIVDVYADHAVSGRTDKRPQFQRMMHDAADGLFNYVIAWKSNRIGRNMLEAMMNEVQLQDFGVKIIYVEENFDDTAAGRFAARSMMNVNQFYSENMAEDIKRGMHDNAAKCKATGALPYGYKIGNNLQYEIDSPKDDIVREIFTRVAHREPFANIYTDLNRRGLKTARGNPWNKTSFATILRNERYRGIYIYDDIRKEGGIPRIVSDELFFKVQEVLKLRNIIHGKHSVGGDYLLTGKLFCGLCESPMVGTSGTSKNGSAYYYYTCNKKNDNHCKKKNIRRDLIETEVARAIKTYILNPKTMRWIVDTVAQWQNQNAANPELQLLQVRLSDCQKSINNLLKAIEQGIITETTKIRLQDLEHEQADISSQISIMQSELTDLTGDDVYAWLNRYSGGNIKDKKFQAELFNTFLIAAYLYNDGTVKILFSPNNYKTVNFKLSSLKNEECSYETIWEQPNQNMNN